MCRVTRGLIAALVIALFVPVTRAANPEAKSFDSISYRDSGGFAGGTGESLSIMADGDVDAQTRDGRHTTLRLQPRELADLNSAVMAVDWQHIERTYRLSGGHDITSRDLVVIVGGNRYETRADMLAKVPDALRQLLDRLEALYRRAVGQAKR